ncbi:hypothetical protein HK098_002432 [Nowakowskiella sp. JEL0407]|nr:hypothetical protein HK098_002432 [Nowakowskiella sp. JEL0407]
MGEYFRAQDFDVSLVPQLKKFAKDCVRLKVRISQGTQEPPAEVMKDEFNKVRRSILKDVFKEQMGLIFGRDEDMESENGSDVASDSGGSEVF